MGLEGDQVGSEQAAKKLFSPRQDPKEVGDGKGMWRKNPMFVSGAASR